LERAATSNSAEENQLDCSRVLNGKTFFIELYGMYTVTLNELNAILKSNIPAGHAKQNGGFKEVEAGEDEPLK
jgi:hypothetical protein